MHTNKLDVKDWAANETNLPFQIKSVREEEILSYARWRVENKSLGAASVWAVSVLLSM